ncbi:PHP domain-containing protein [Niveibacterium sp. 24ML]|uniref:3',5'-nucleoside bisphosphate phosphatase n=1 Tax=Niveibacterium sp. 24ML TaxID=2985512 RepID=UPI00226D4C4E|nr:3',5'-nucleoside bisphosphate phosphatase [Niveibacterium sp. 24ML]MCX9156944.1 PHP domain-containing protein [Niveibacterium sp. 24ML]
MIPLNADLHCHSTYSDGLLEPAEVVARAARNGVELLALTDHDEIGGLPEARATASEFGVRFVNGVEVSVSWGDQTVHIVGLGLDPDNAALREGLASVRAGRDGRAARMSDALAAIGIRGAYEGALKYVGNPALVSRSHFARYLVEIGAARDVKTVFDHYLVRGKPGYVEHVWATMDDALGWIHGAGGIAVVAHPGRYRLSKAELNTLFERFHDLGGGAIEVVSGSHHRESTLEFARVARRFGFLASRASDFHGPGESSVDLGGADRLPEDLTPVWSRF